MFDIRTRIDLHSKSPRIVHGNSISIRAGNVWGLLEGIEYRDGFTYRMIKDRRGSRGFGEWLLVESQEWDRDCLSFVKDVIMEHGFAVDGVVVSGDKRFAVRFIPQSRLTVRTVKAVDKPGFYLYRREEFKQEYSLDDTGSELVLLIEEEKLFPTDFKPIYPK